MTSIVTEFERLVDRFDNADGDRAVRAAQAWGGKLLSKLGDAWPFSFPCPPPQGDAERDEIVWAGAWVAAVAAIADQHAAELPANVNAARIDVRGNGVTSGVITKADWRTHAANGAILSRWLAGELPQKKPKSATRRLPKRDRLRRDQTIRESVRAGGLSQTDAAKQYGVSEATVSRILRKKVKDK